MKEIIDIIGLGELLVDFTYAGKSTGGMTLFEQNPGGAPANLLTTAAHMGISTAFIGKVGNDMHGAFLKDILTQQGIDTSSLIVSDEVFTTLAFVDIGADGEREFSFARKPGADTRLEVAELNIRMLQNCKILHVGSLSLTDEPARTATIKAVKMAANAMISFDPNYRPSLWPAKEQAIKMMIMMTAEADLVKVSEEESFMITGESDYVKAAQIIIGMGPSVIAITLGKDGVYVARKGQGALVPGFPVEAIDTTGAGDSFWGGFLSEVIKSEKPLEQLGLDELIHFARFGNATASLCVRGRGGIPSIPYEKDVRAIL